MTAPTRTRPAVRSTTRTAERSSSTRTAERPAATPAALQPGTSPTERPSGRARSAAAQRAYARRAQREGRAPERREQTDSAAGRATFVVLIIALLVVGVAATLWLSTQAISDSYRLEQAKKEATDLAERAAMLQREVTKQDSASELAKRAMELGMVPATDPARLVVQPDGSVVVVGEPKPAQNSGPPPAANPDPAPPADPPADPGTGHQPDAVPPGQQAAPPAQGPDAPPAPQAAPLPGGG